MARLRLFLYGTLQPAARTGMSRWIERRILWSRAATATGRMFALREGKGWFPALVPAKGYARVRGTLCELDLRPGELARLDRYEGTEYRRVVLPVRTGNRGTVAAQAYLWRTALAGDARPVRSGDFLGWLRDNGLDAFSSPGNDA